MLYYLCNNSIAILNQNILIKSGGGTGPVKPGNLHIVCIKRV